MEPAAWRGSGSSLRLLATFDLEPSNLLRLYGLRLLQAPDGRRIVYAAQSGNRRTAINLGKLLFWVLLMKCLHDNVAPQACQAAAR